VCEQGETLKGIFMSEEKITHSQDGFLSKNTVNDAKYHELHKRSVQTPDVFWGYHGLDEALYKSQKHEF
jgi:hypothetical protein